MLKTRPAAAFLSFGPVTLLCWLQCGSFLFYLMSKGSVKLSDCKRHRFCYIFHWWIRGGTELFPDSAAVVFTQTARKNKGASFLHWQKPDFSRGLAGLTSDKGQLRHCGVIPRKSTRGLRGATDVHSAGNERHHSLSLLSWWTKWSV